MKRFRFPLHSVAVLRAHEEIRAREAFAASVRVYVQAEETMARARACTAALASALQAGRCELYRAAEATNSLAAYRRECAAEMEAERLVIAARAEMKQRGDDYVEAHRKLKVVVRLEERARISHRQEAFREEQAEFDDSAGRRVARPALLRS